MSRAVLLVARLRSRVITDCHYSLTHSSDIPPPACHHTNSCSRILVSNRGFHTTRVAMKVSGSQRKQFKEELNKDLKTGIIEKSGRVLQFDKVPLGEKGGKEAGKGEYLSEIREIKGKKVADANDNSKIQIEDRSVIVLDENYTEYMNPEVPNGASFIEEAPVEILTDPVETTSEETTSEDTATTNVPSNIIGDLESLFSENTGPEMAVQQEEGIVETSGYNVDYAVYYTSREGDRCSLPDEPVYGTMCPSGEVPLSHVVRFLRDLKCFDNEIIQGKKGSFIENTIIVSTHNRKHLKDVSRTFYKMCRDDYELQIHSMREGKTQSWIAYDIGHSFIHFFLPEERARINLESLSLGLDQEEEEEEAEEAKYTAGLLQGLFPDEDFTKLGKPFELVRADKEKAR